MLCNEGPRLALECGTASDRHEVGRHLTRGTRMSRQTANRSLVIAIGLLLFAITAGTAHAQSLPVNISFQPASFPLQSGYRGDFGNTFGDRGSGYSYGWNADHTARTFAYSALPGYETVWGAAWSLIKMLPASSTSWEIAVPNGSYDVTILAAGYQCQGTLQQI